MGSEGGEKGEGGGIEGRRGRNRVEIELLDRAEEWSCDGSGEKKGMGMGKEGISSCSHSTRSGSSSS